MKELITAMHISEARKAGLGSITVPPGALITPQARDDAKSYGIALVTREEPALAPSAVAPVLPDPLGRAVRLPAPEAAPAPVAALAPADAFASAAALAPAAAPTTVFAPAAVTAAAAKNFTASPAAQEPASPAPVQTDLTALAARVLARLNELLAPRGGLAAVSGLEQIIAEVLGQYAGQGGLATPDGPQNTQGLDFARLSAAEGSQPGPRGVELEEAIVPDVDGPGVTRLSWADSAFSWIFENDEVLVVTGGEIAVNGALLRLGEALRVRAGTPLALEARGAASCVCSSWPKP